MNFKCDYFQHFTIFAIKRTESLQRKWNISIITVTGEEGRKVKKRKGGGNEGGWAGGKIGRKGLRWGRMKGKKNVWGKEGREGSNEIMK